MAKKQANLDEKVLMALIRDVKPPVRGTDVAAGIDFFIPEDWDGSGLTPLLKGGYFVLKPQQACLIPSGVKVKVPRGYMLLCRNKSGVSTKLGVVVGADVVDQDYQGEVHFHLINTSDVPVSLYRGQKITQFILVPVSYAKPCLVAEAELYTEATNRGEGGFGSTGA